MTCARECADVQSKKRLTLRRIAVCYMCLFVIILFMKNSSAAAKWVSAGISLCARTLIPSLFPFMVVSSMVISSGACTEFFGALAKPLCSVLRVSRDGACALVLGWLCGFPIGARCARELYGNGRISFDEYERLTCISGTPSPAFLILSVGGGMLGDVRLGAVLYFVCVSCAILMGIVLRMRRGERAYAPICRTKSTRKPLLECFVRSVSDSATAMMTVCSFVIFFSAFLGVLEQSIKFLGLSDTAHAVVFCIFEMTTGLYRVCALAPASALPLCALAAGWAGLCVHFQTIAICGGTGLRLSRYFSVQLLRALLCAGVCCIAQWVIQWTYQFS